MPGPMTELTDQYLTNAHAYTTIGAQTLSRTEGVVLGFEPDPNDDTVTFLVSQVLALEDVVRRLAAALDDLSGAG